MATGVGIGWRSEAGSEGMVLVAATPTDVVLYPGCTITDATGVTEVVR